MASENSGNNKPKVTTAGLINVSKQYSSNQTTSKTTTTSKPTTTQTLNLYGTPDTNSRPVIKSPEPKAKTSSQIAADAQSILDQLALVQKNVDAIVIPEIVIADPVIKVPGPTGTGGSGISYYVAATPPTPSPIATIVVTPPPPAVKTATPDIVLFDEEGLTIEGMFDSIFENIGGQELISITRSDIVNGQKISYQPIKNLSAIQQRYNPNNILGLQQNSDTFFAGFSIKLEDKIPETGNGTNGENVYLNSTGDLVIEFINLNPDEQVETQITVNGTIYEADLGDYTS